MSRKRFFLLRLAVSVPLLLLTIAVIRTLWYPGVYYDIAGAAKQVWILVAVVLVIGPALSTLVWVPGKAGLHMDLVILAGLELAVLAVAATLLYLRQPYFAVFAVDRFEARSRMEVVDFEAARERFGRRPGHEPRLVVARLPDDAEKREALIDETLLQGLPDIDQRPEFWAPYATGVSEVRAAARPVRELQQSAGATASSVSSWLRANGRSADSFLFLPLIGKAGDAAIIIDRASGFPVATIAADPWISAPQDGHPARDIEQAHE